LANAAGAILPILALAGNAAIADPLAVVVHGLDLTRPQPFRGYATPDAGEWFPPGERRLDTEGTLALIEAIGRHPQGGLLHQAVEAYRGALGHWIPEQRLMAGEFLFMTAETLSRFLSESRAGSLGITPKNHARLLKVSSPSALRRQYLSDEVFAGDTDALEAMEGASNGFEHGYMSIDQVRGLLDPVLERAMGHVRRGLITASDIDVEIQNRLLAENYAEPRGLVPEISFVTGELRCLDPAQPPTELSGIELKWNKLVPVATRTPEGGLNLAFPREVSPTLPPNVTFDLAGFGMRAAHMKPTGESPDVEVRRLGEPPTT
jgi:hypothetical protein